jgi:phosphomannomutase
MTRAGLLDEFEPEKSKAILAAIKPDDPEVIEAQFASDEVQVTRASSAADGPTAVDADVANQLRTCRDRLERYFCAAEGYGAVTRINLLDGVRVWFDNGDVAHLRPSGNAPQFRIYAVSDSQARADEMVAAAIAEPSGLLRRMEQELAGPSR